MIKIMKNSIFILFMILLNVCYSSDTASRLNGEPIDWIDLHSGKKAYVFEIPLWQKVYNGKFDELDDFLYLRSDSLADSFRLTRERMPDVIKSHSDYFRNYICNDKKRKEDCRELCRSSCMPVFDSPSHNAKVIGFHDSIHLEIFGKILVPSPVYTKRITPSISRMFYIISRVEHRVFKGKVYEWAKLQTGPSSLDAWIRTVELPLADAPNNANDGDTVPVDFKRSFVSSLKHTDSSSKLCIQDIKGGIVSFYAILPNIVSGIPVVEVESDKYFKKMLNANSRELDVYIEKLNLERQKQDNEVARYVSLDKMWVDFIKETESLQPHMFKMKLSDFYAYYLHDYKNNRYENLFDINMGLSILGSKGCDTNHKYLFKKIDDFNFKKAHLFKYYPIYTDVGSGRPEYPMVIMNSDKNLTIKNILRIMFNDVVDKETNDHSNDVDNTFFKGDIMLPYIYPDMKYPENLKIEEP